MINPTAARQLEVRVLRFTSRAVSAAPLQRSATSAAEAGCIISLAFLSDAGVCRAFSLPYSLEKHPNSRSFALLRMTAL
jgi:hypothetical protein